MSETSHTEKFPSILSFHLPRYHELPDVGLYLEQVVRYVNRCLISNTNNQITSSMVSNYVKQKIIPGPIKKAYGADSIAYLIFVAYTKTIISMEDIRMLEEIQKRSYDLPIAYNYFCDELENLLQFVYGIKSEPDVIGNLQTPEKELLRTALLSIAHKIHLDFYLQTLRNSSSQSEDAPSP